MFAEYELTERFQNLPPRLHQRDRLRSGGL